MTWGMVGDVECWAVIWGMVGDVECWGCGL